MSRLLLVFAHPRFEKSVVNLALLQSLKGLESITHHSLYDSYPDFYIDVARERELLLAHDRILIQAPLQWYAPPAIVKHWFDVVFEEGWAYGGDTFALQGKSLHLALTTGASIYEFDKNGSHGHSLNQFLLPIERTAAYCKMSFGDNFPVYEGRNLSADDLTEKAEEYRDFTRALITSKQVS